MEVGTNFYRELLQEVDNAWNSLEQVFNNLWENYRINFKELIYNLVELQDDYERLLGEAAETLGLGASFLVEAVKLWLESKDELFEEDRKVKKWGAVALGLAGVAAAGYSIYQTYKAHKKIEELKEKLDASLQKLLEERNKLIDLKIKSLTKLEPYIEAFKQSSIILIDILYSLAQEKSMEKEIYQRLNKIIPVYLKFNIILLSVDFLKKNYKLLYSSAFVNPSFILYIKEISYKKLDEIYDVLVEKYKILDRENPVVKYIIQSPLVFYSPKWFNLYQNINIVESTPKEGKENAKL